LCMELRCNCQLFHGETKQFAQALLLYWMINISELS
jgi:hypothetical protein